MTSRRQSRREDVQRRLKALSPESKRCIVLGCSEPTRASSGDGFDKRLCRRPAEHLSTHGSAFRKTYTAKELAPGRTKAKAWLKSNADSQACKIAKERVRILYRSAGPLEPAYRLKGMPPKERSRKAWARLREALIAPERILEAWLAVSATIATDGEADTRPEFRRVQAAKIVHRLASGTHKVWHTTASGGHEITERLEVYPRSRGRVLRHLGEDIERACETLPDLDAYRVHGKTNPPFLDR